ncbi:hypothetical protein D3C71_1522680 [compost metagenome]
MIRLFMVRAFTILAFSFLQLVIGVMSFCKFVLFCLPDSILGCALSLIWKNLILGTWIKLMSGEHG